MPVDLTQGSQIDPADLPGEAIIFGRTAGMREVRGKIDRVADSNKPVLIQGESGTGKEVIAKFLHSRSVQKNQPFVKLNCAAIPANLLERELLGEERVTPSGANESKPGLVEIANAGTIFLKEVGNLNFELHIKLLQLLQGGRYFRVGGTEELSTHARFIFAAGSDLDAEGMGGRFRRDLFEHIQISRLRLLPLRERTEDIPELCEYLMQKLVKRFGRNEQPMIPAALELLKQWTWPGNLREFENSIARIIILGCEEELNAVLRRRISLASAASNGRAPVEYSTEASGKASSTATHATILRVLQANHWNRRKTAEELKMSYRSLLHQLRDAGMPVRRRGHKGPAQLQ